HQMVLGTTRSADALSVDALVKDKTLTPQRFDRAYGGIPTAMNIATVAVYFISGVAKVRSPQGWSWAKGNTLRDQIAADAIRKEVLWSTPRAAAGYLYSPRAFFTLWDVSTLITKVGVPVTFTNRRCGHIFWSAGWCMHL